MPKIYKEHYLSTLKREKLIEMVLEWQAGTGATNVVLTEETKTKIFNMFNTWVGKVIGRKVNNMHPGTPEMLEVIVENLAILLENE